MLQHHWELPAERCYYGMRPNLFPNQPSFYREEKKKKKKELLVAAPPQIMNWILVEGLDSEVTAATMYIEWVI